MRRNAAEQMRADVALLDRVVAGGPPGLRLYRWLPPALSLGRHQPVDDVDRDACAAHGVEVVRRPTGGRAILHGADVTYAVAVRPPPEVGESVLAGYAWLAAGLVTGLAALGVHADVALDGSHAVPPPYDGVDVSDAHEADAQGLGAACFARALGADLRVDRRKICGSAQLRRRGVILQHGSVRTGTLGLDEYDLLAPPPGVDGVDWRAERSHDLARRTTTLDALGVRSSPAEVAACLADGFRTALGVRLERSPSIARTSRAGRLTGSASIAASG